jgi:hypothetical protein
MLVQFSKRANEGSRRSAVGDLDDSVGKGLWGSLRQIAPDAALDDPMRSCRAGQQQMSWLQCQKSGGDSVDVFGQFDPIH